MTERGAAPVTSAAHGPLRTRTGAARPARTLDDVKSKDTAFVGGPLDGRELRIPLTVFHNVGKVYRVPVPAYHDVPATTLVYRRAKEYDARGRWRWRYEYDPDGDTAGGLRWPWSRPPVTSAATATTTATAAEDEAGQPAGGER